ncbi:MAG: ATP-binding protein [Proteobacteria bacterium]|nr:ATP-binding protein [Pseudomonadota bacterium]
MRSLKTKTYLLLGSTVLIFLGFTYAIAVKVLLDGFGMVEKADVAGNIERIRNRIQGEIHNIATKNRDWAAWDDVWNYMKTRNKEFAQGNLDPKATLKNLSTDLLLMATTSGTITDALQWNPETDSPQTPDQELIDSLTSPRFLSQWFTPNNPESFSSGIATFQGQHWLLSVRAITNTAGDGEVRGLMIFGKLVTDAFVGSISDELKLSLKIHSKSSSKQLFNISNFTDESLRIDIPVQNYNATPAFNLEATFARPVMTQGKVTLFSMLTLFAVGTLGLSFVIFWQLDAKILRRISHIKDETQLVMNGSKTDIESNDKAQDEITELTYSIQLMLKTIGDKNREIKEISDNVKAGFFMTDLDQLVQPGSTKSTEHLLSSTKISGKRITDILNLTGKDILLFDAMYEQLKEDIMPDEITVRMLPPRIKIENKSISIDSALIRDQNGQPHKVLFSITDATELTQVEQTNNVNRSLIQILKSKPAFLNLLSDMENKNRNWTQALTSNPQDSKLQALIKLELHSLNGNLRCFSLDDWVMLVTNIENKEKVELSDITNLFSGVQSWMTSNGAVLMPNNKSFSDPANYEWTISEDILTKIEKTDLKSFKSNDDFKTWFINQIRQIKFENMEGPLTQLTKVVSEKLEKKCQLKISGQDLSTSKEIFQAISEILPHLIRNAIDHGIEPPELRNKNKPDIGKISIDFKQGASNQLIITIEDDGKGIDVHALKSKAQIMNLKSSDKLNFDNVTNLIFHPNLTTKEEIGEFSGRGIGMPAVKEMVEHRLHGSIEVISKLGTGTKFVIIIPQLADPLKIAA